MLAHCFEDLKDLSLESEPSIEAFHSGMQTTVKHSALANVNEPKVIINGHTELKIVEAPLPVSISQHLYDDQPSNYSVQIRGPISGESGVYAELVTLLSTITEGRIRIFVESPGGDVYNGYRIASSIAGCKVEVETIAAGMAASAASLIWLYGHKRRVYRCAKLMFHCSSHFDYGPTPQIGQFAEFMHKSVVQVYAQKAFNDGILTEEEAACVTNGSRDVWISGMEFHDGSRRIA